MTEFEISGREAKNVKSLVALHGIMVPTKSERGKRLSLRKEALLRGFIHRGPRKLEHFCGCFKQSSTVYSK